MTTAAISRRRKPRGRYPKTQDGAIAKRQKRLQEYLIHLIKYIVPLRRTIQANDRVLIL